MLLQLLEYCHGDRDAVNYCSCWNIVMRTEMQFVTAPPEYCHQDSDAVHHCSYWNIVVVQQCLCDHTYRLTCTPAHHTTTQHNYTCHSTTWKTLLHTLLHDTAPTHAHMHTHTHTHVRIHTSQPYKYLSRENTHTHAATSHSMHAHTHTPVSYTHLTLPTIVGV